MRLKHDTHTADTKKAPVRIIADQLAVDLRQTHKSKTINGTARVTTGSGKGGGLKCFGADKTEEQRIALPFYPDCLVLLFCDWAGLFASSCNTFNSSLISSNSSRMFGQKICPCIFKPAGPGLLGQQYK
jgi:hypothetical protein